MKQKARKKPEPILCVVRVSRLPQINDPLAGKSSPPDPIQRPTAVFPNEAGLESFDSSKKSQSYMIAVWLVYSDCMRRLRFALKQLSHRQTDCRIMLLIEGASVTIDWSVFGT
jgi:hypothetical protein